MSPRPQGDPPGDPIVAALHRVGGEIAERARALAQDRRIEVVGGIGTAHLQSRGDHVRDALPKRARVSAP